MTFSAQCTQATRDGAAAVVHVDGTARPQTVTADQSPLLHHLLVEMGRVTSVPILVNTSFNLDGEPIVETPEDAIRTFLRSDLLSALIVGDYLVERAP
jgi:carbamoyltransferase